MPTLVKQVDASKTDAELAEAVHECASRLNDAVADAMRAGLTVELEALHINGMGVDEVRVMAKVLRLFPRKPEMTYPDLGERLREMMHEKFERAGMRVRL